jgi:hypothetical protein
MQNNRHQIHMLIRWRQVDYIYSVDMIRLFCNKDINLLVRFSQAVDFPADLVSGSVHDNRHKYLISVDNEVCPNKAELIIIQ